MNISNPLLNEQKRLRRNSLVLLVLLAVSMALLDYLIALSDRQALRQAQLNAATADLDHQLLPLLHLTHALQQEAELILQQGEQAQELNKGQVTALPSGDADAPVMPYTAEEVRLLNELEPWFRQHLKSSRYLRNISYLSVGRQWFQLADRGPTAAETAIAVASQISQLPLLTLNSEPVNLLVVDRDHQLFALHSVVRNSKNIIGHLVLEIDLAAMLKQVTIPLAGSTLMLMDKDASVLIAAKDNLLSSTTLYDGQDANDSVQHLDIVPLVLHIQPDRLQDIQMELKRFVAELLFYSMPLLVLYFYMLFRFKRNVLRPFARLLIHIARLERGDVQGVRHVPVEWDSVFKQTEQLRDRGLEKSAD